VGLDVDDNKWGAKPNQIGKTSSKGGNHLEIMEPKRRGQQQSCSFCFSLSLSHTHTQCALSNVEYPFECEVSYFHKHNLFFACLNFKSFVVVHVVLCFF
jgi:hypothetical protein